MDKEAAKKPEVIEELKFKYGEGRITEDEICPKCGRKFQRYSHGVLEGENGLLQVMPTTVYFVTKQSQISPKHHQASMST